MHFSKVISSQLKCSIYNENPSYLNQRFLNKGNGATLGHLVISREIFSQQTMENSEWDGNTRPPDLPLD